MFVRIRRILLLAIALGVVGLAIVAFGKTSASQRLSGTWSGYIAGNAVKRFHMRIVVNAGETGGSWRISASCHGSLAFQSISGGYHHYTRRVASGANCAGGDVDCLKRVGANVYDSVTSRLGHVYDSAGTLRRAVI